MIYKVDSVWNVCSSSSLNLIYRLITMHMKIFHSVELKKKNQNEQPTNISSIIQIIPTYTTKLCVVMPA